MRYLMAAVVLMLAACGADGDPTPPTTVAPPGISLSGTVGIGVSGKL